MYKYYIVSTVLVCLYTSVYSSSLPSFITPCRSDLDNEALSQCVLAEARRVQKEFAKGIPELGVEPLDPMQLGRINISAASLIIRQNNGLIKGASKLEIKEFKFKGAEGSGKIVGFGNLTASSDFFMEGRLLVIPLSGNGKFKIRMENTEITIRFNTKLVRGADGHDHLFLYDVKPSHSYGNVRMRMDGLFGDDKVLDETLNSVINENWRDLMKDLGPPAVKAVSDRTVAIINTFYSKVPYEELFAPAQ